MGTELGMNQSMRARVLDRVVALSCWASRALSCLTVPISLKPIPFRGSRLLGLKQRLSGTIAVRGEIGNEEFLKIANFIIQVVTQSWRRSLHRLVVISESKPLAILKGTPPPQVVSNAGILIHNMYNISPQHRRAIQTVEDMTSRHAV